MRAAATVEDAERLNVADAHICARRQRGFRIGEERRADHLVIVNLILIHVARISLNAATAAAATTDADAADAALAHITAAAAATAVTIGAANAEMQRLRVSARNAVHSLLSADESDCKRGWRRTARRARTLDNQCKSTERS